MPLFVYEGQANSLRVSGRTLHRGVPTELEGRAAETAATYAAKHRELRALDGAEEKPAKGTSKSGGSNAALEKRRALVARAKELGIPAKGKNDELEAAIAAAEAAQA